MLLDEFAKLFQGRVDAFGGGDEGKCVRVHPHQTFPWKPHLEGHQPIGVYPVVNQNLCRWGVVDFDRKSENHPSFDYETEEECHTAAVNLQKVLAALGVTSWIERTRSCGRHVWVFAEGWLAASVMRRALLCACQVAGVSAREVNPKQETLAEGQLGNYVRVPFPGAIGRALSHQVVLDGAQGTLALSDFVERALAARTSPQTLEAIAAKWKAPEAVVSTIDWGTPVASLDVTLVSRLTATGRSVFTNGPNDGDRSRGMVYLARQAKLSGLGPHEAMALVSLAHWNKYRGRADEVKQLRDIVERAWA